MKNYITTESINRDVELKYSENSQDSIVHQQDSAIIEFDPDVATAAFDPEMLVLFNQMIQDPDRVCFFKQGYEALKIAFEKQGIAIGTSKTCFALISSGYVGLSVVWDLMGSAYSFKEMYDGGHIIGRELGDIGGWSSLAFFDLITLKYALNASIAESNFIGLTEICQRFMEKNEVQPDVAYELIINRLDSLNSRCIFQKCVASRVLIALDIVGKRDESKRYPESKWAIDVALEHIYRTIETEYKHRCDLQHYFHRLYEGQKSIKGIREQGTSIILGAIVPIALFATVVLSAIGEVKLGQQVIGDQDDLPSYGHLGEWLSNMVLSATAGAYYHHRYMLNRGDCEILECIIEKKLAEVYYNAGYYDRLCDIGIQEQSERNSMSKDRNFIELKLKKYKRPLDAIIP